MAISTVYTYLMYKKSSTFEKVMDITSYGDLGGAPEMQDATTMSNKVQVNVPGVRGMGSGIQFEGFFKDKEEFAKLKALEGTEQEFAVYFGGTDNGDGTSTPTGDKLKIGFKGYPSFYLTGGSVNGLVGMACAIANTNEPHVVD